VFLPCLVLIVVGFALLAATRTRLDMIGAAVIFGIGFGNAYPAYAAHVMAHVDPARRGAAFGGILAAFDTGIGTGSVTSGWIIERSTYGTAFAVAALLASLSMPFFLATERRLLRPGV
jgi:predicted MFS family arabinose efflux permease